MSSDTTMVEPQHDGYGDLAGEPRREESRSSPLSRARHFPVDDQWIETQLARADRWRQPAWPLVCRVAERHREKRARHLRRQPVEIAAGKLSHDDVQPWLQRYWLAWVCSIFLHVAAVAALAAWALPAGKSEEEDAIYVIGDDRRTDVLANPPQLLEISVPSLTWNRSSGAFSSPISEPSPSDHPGMLPPAVSLAAFIEDVSGPEGEAPTFLGGRGEAMAVAGANDSGAEFYGVKATGDRFVFLIDCSVTMSVGTRWMDALRELTAAVQRLGEDKFFYVIFFSEESQAMFDSQHPEADFLPATPENVDRLRRWLLTIKTGMSTQPAKSVKRALSLAPDAIYLLSDGEFEDHDPTLDLLSRENFLRANNAQKIPLVVHTLSFRRQGNIDRLRNIARENGGRYVCIVPGATAPQ